MSDTRVCASCKLEKPNTFEHFSRRYANTKALDSWCRVCRRKNRREWGARNRQRIAESAAARRREIRLLVLTHYSGDPPTCACCDEPELAFLALDHTEGGGRRHRAEIGQHGASFYRWIVAQGFPDGYRVLCANCNAAIGNYGACPHQSARMM